MVAAYVNNRNFGKELDNWITGYRSGDEHNSNSPYYEEPSVPDFYCPLCEKQLDVDEHDDGVYELCSCTCVDDCPQCGDIVKTKWTGFYDGSSEVVVACDYGCKYYLEKELEAA